MNTLRIYCLIVGLSFSCKMYAQDVLPWYIAESATAIDTEKHEDCLEKYGQASINEFVERPLFKYTNKQAREKLQNKFLIEGSAHITHLSEHTFLILNLKVNSLNARHTFGQLDDQAQIKVYLFDGTHIYLSNIEKNKGRLDRKNENISYQGRFPLTKKALKSLKDQWIEKIGVVWSEGYQEYDIDNMDLIYNQLNCLNEK